MPVETGINFQGQSSRRLTAFAKKLLPQTAAKELRRFGEFSSSEKRIYLQTRIRDSLRPRIPAIPAGARSYLFVCYGNIMRSPMCEALMKRELEGTGCRDFSVTSAGLNATPGRPAHPWAIAAAREFGISLDGHRARPISREMLNGADAIFVMDYQNCVQLFSRWQPAHNRVFMFSAYAGERQRLPEITDPYYADERQTRACYQLLNTCTKNLVSRLHVGGSECAKKHC